MKFVAKVVLDVNDADEKGIDLKDKKVSLSVQEAISDALFAAEGDGFNHPMEEDLQILLDYVQVKPLE